MNHSYIKTSEVIKAIQRINPSFFVGAKGASEEDIQFLTEKLGKPLPLAYLDFLRCIGESSGNVELFDPEYETTFSPTILYEVFEKLNEPISSLLPVSLKDTDCGGFLYCLDIKNSENYNDPEVYMTELSTYNNTYTVELHVAKSFSHFIARELFTKTLVEAGKNKISIRIAFKEQLIPNVDSLIERGILEIGFRPFIAGCSIYERGNVEFITYERFPEQNYYFLFINSTDPLLDEQLRRKLIYKQEWIYF